MRRLYLIPALLAFGVFSLFGTQEASAAPATSDCWQYGPGQIGSIAPNYPERFGSWVDMMARASNRSVCSSYRSPNPTWTHTGEETDGSVGFTSGTTNLGAPWEAYSYSDASIPLFSVTANIIRKNRAWAVAASKPEVMDLVLIDNPNYDPNNPEEITMNFCSEFTPPAQGGILHSTTSTVAMGFHAYNGEQPNPDNFSVSGGNTTNHATEGNDVCKTATITMDGQYAYFWVKLKASTLGQEYADSSGSHNFYTREGNLTSDLKFTAPIKTLLPDATCYSASGSFPGCERPLPDEPLACLSPSGGNPINLALGVKHQSEGDYAGGFLSLSRLYRSDAGTETGRFGENWRHNFDRNANVLVTPEKTTADVTTVGGATIIFRKESGSWSPAEEGVTSTFEDVFDSVPMHVGYLHTTESDTREFYDLDGLMSRIEYRGGEALDFTHDGSDRLSTVINEQGKTLTFSYDGSDRVSSVVTPTGTFSYTYDSNNNLSTVTRPDSEVRTYHYEDTNFVNALTGITDEESVRFATWTYDTEGRAISSEHAGGVESFDIAYNSDGTVTTTNSLGKDTTYTFTNVNGVPMVSNVDGHASTNCAAASKSKTYSYEGFLESETDWNGNTTTYVRDSDGLETSRTEDAYGSDARTITTTYDSTYRLPDVITETGKTTDYDYDSDGRVTSMTVTDTNTSETRATTYSYYANTTDSNGNTVLGKLHQVDGPRTDVTDVTTYTYDTSDRLVKVANALGHETETTSFDSANRPLTTEDINDVETTFVYDSLGLVTSTTVASGTANAETTSYTHDANGNVLTITQPNGTVITNTYDDAQRLTAIEDDLGNTITYTLDDAGNVIKEEYKDTSSTLKYTISKTYDELSRIIEDIDANLNKTTYAYDVNGNQTSATDGNLNATSFAFDGLNRLVSQTNALSDVTSYDFNDLNQNGEITDTRSNVTTYSYNAFGDVTQEVSPDRGTIAYTYDKAGNVTSMTDALSVVTNYTHDALNRITSIAYPSDSSLNISVTYDSATGCGASKGRLCSVSDASGTADYVYDDFGRLANVTKTRGTLSFVTSYTYEPGGMIKSITLPSGRDIDYTLDGNGQITAVASDVNGFSTTLASSISYLPFGPVSSMSYGNSVALTNTYNSAYQLTNRQIGSLLSDSYTYDNAGNVTVKGTTSYTYDDLNRLTAEGSDSYTYDAVGNRTSKNIDAYVYPSTNSKVNSIASVSVTHDAAGSITADTQRTYVIDAAGRLEEVKISGTTEGEYVYNAHGQRTKKISNSVTTHYVYGHGGLLYGEYDASGNMLVEYVYLNNEPLAQIDDVSSSDVVTYLHTDHLGTPRYGTNSSGTQVWSWVSDAFGVGAPAGSVTVNLRFAGQYFDDESDLHYNWNRYYDPETGRYISSDPIGLAGGPNTFGYVGGNPVQATDSTGLAPELDDRWPREEVMARGGLPGQVLSMYRPWLFGITIHRHFAQHVNQHEGFSGSYRFDNGLRPDAYNESCGSIYELKPPSWNVGHKYVQALNQVDSYVQAAHAQDQQGKPGVYKDNLFNASDKIDLGIIRYDGYYYRIWAYPDPSAGGQSTGLVFYDYVRIGKTLTERLWDIIKHVPDITITVPECMRCRPDGQGAPAY